MAGQEETKDDALAAKAYEAAAAKTPVAPIKSGADQGVPGKPEGAAPAIVKPDAAKSEAAKSVKPIEATPVAPKQAASRIPEAKPAKTLPGLPQPIASAAKAPEKAAKAKVVKPTPAPKVKAPVAPAPKVSAPVANVAPAKAAKKVPVQPVKATVAAATPAVSKSISDVAKAAPAAAATSENKVAETAESKTNMFAGLFTPFILEEKTMDISANFAGFQDTVTEAQAKAKAAFEKSSVAFGEAGDFAKGNVEAVLESSKIFAEGLQGMGSELVAEGRSAFETFTGDIKELAAAKSPTDFFKLQGDILRKNFDSAVAYGSKNSEAALKLFSDTMAPISGRVSVAVEKARQVAA